MGIDEVGKLITLIDKQRFFFIFYLCFVDQRCIWVECSNLIFKLEIPEFWRIRILWFFFGSADAGREKRTKPMTRTRLSPVFNMEVVRL